MKDYLYEAHGVDGQIERGSVVAINVADARFQLTRMGLRQVQILSSDFLPPTIQGLDDPAIAAVAAKSQSDSLPIAIVRMLSGNWIVWLPTGIFAVWNAAAGQPWTLGDWVSFALFGLSVLVMLLIVTPSVMYQLILTARLYGRYRKALAYVRIVELLNVFGFMPRLAIVGERAKAIAGLGRRKEALALMDGAESLGHENEVAATRMAIAEALGDYAEMVALQETYSQKYPEHPEYRIDLALALARYTDRLDEAGRLLAASHPVELSSLAAAGWQFARGVLAQRRGDNASALTELMKAREGIAALSSPLTFGMTCEINAYMAISLKSLGRRDQADVLWRAAWPVLQHHDADRWRSMYGE